MGTKFYNASTETLHYDLDVKRQVYESCCVRNFVCDDFLIVLATLVF